MAYNGYNAANDYTSFSSTTSIRISKKVLEKLDKLGVFKESYSSLIDRLVSERLGYETPQDQRSF